MVDLGARAVYGDDIAKRDEPNGLLVDIGAKAFGFDRGVERTAQHRVDRRAARQRMSHCWSKTPDTVATTQRGSSRRSKPPIPNGAEAQG
jgi:hypothetical protein